MSPILEDAWVFAGKSPRHSDNLATTPTSSAAATVGLGSAFSITSCLAGAPQADPQADNQITTTTRAAISGLGVAQSSSTVFTQSSSVSCSSFGESLEKVRASFYDTYAFLYSSLNLVYSHVEVHSFMFHVDGLGTAPVQVCLRLQLVLRGGRVHAPQGHGSFNLALCSCYSMVVEGCVTVKQPQRGAYSMAFTA